jgi:hypothetical protein
VTEAPKSPAVAGTPMAGPRPSPILLLDAFSSLKLTVVLLCLLLYLTWRGTIAQVDLGLHEAQSRYFNPWIATDRIGSFEFPIPGGYLVLLLLALNLACGGIARLRLRKGTVGVLIVHLGIALMLVAGAIKFHDSDEGYVRFHEGQTQSEFVSYHEWEIAIGEPRGERIEEWVVPAEHFVELRAQDRATFTHADLPFEIELDHFARNSDVKPVSDDALAGSAEAIDGFYLRPLPLDKESEANLAGTYATFRGKDGATATPSRAILWGLEVHPLTVRCAGRAFLVELRKKRHPIDFDLRLDKFYKSTHPGVEIARDYSSDVTRIEDGIEHSLKIRMNEPMRHAGYVFYQSKWSEPDSRSNGRYYSILAVVRNPSDQWPLWSCVVIGLGLSIHFGIKLTRYARSQAARRTTS